jgi:hypothetical protein
LAIDDYLPGFCISRKRSALLTLHDSSCCFNVSNGVGCLGLREVNTIPGAEHGIRDNVD